MWGIAGILKIDACMTPEETAAVERMMSGLLHRGEPEAHFPLEFRGRL
jgi:hypothetical protein